MYFNYHHGVSEGGSEGVSEGGSEGFSRGLVCNVLNFIFNIMMGLLYIINMVLLCHILEISIWFQFDTFSIYFKYGDLLNLLFQV